MRKARNGSGSIRQRKTGKLAGKWRLQWSYEDPMTTETVSVDKTFGTEGEAQDHLDTIKAEIRTGQLLILERSKKALTLNAWFDELAGTKANEYKGLWKEDGTALLTIRTRIIRFDRNVRGSTLATMPIRQITTEHVRAFYRDLRTSGKTTATIKDVKGVLVKVVNDAVDTYEKLPNLRNVFAKVKVENPPSRKAVALTVLQAKKAIARQTSTRDRALLGLLLLGGLRLSELMALTKDQVDFKKGIIVIDRAVRLGPTGAQTVGLPKGGTPRNPKARLVVMCPSLAELLAPLVARPNTYLFSAAYEDQPRMKKLIYATWRKIKRNSKYLPSEMVIKDCRVTHNNWIEKLMTTVSTSTRLEHMGHSTNQRNTDHNGLGVNLTNYTRFLSQAHDELREQLEKTLGLKGRPMLELLDEEALD